MIVKALIITVLLFQMHHCYRYPSPLHYYVYNRVVFETEEPTTKTTPTTTKLTPQAEVLKYQKAFDEVINKIRKTFNDTHTFVDLDAFLQDLETTRLVR